MRLPKSSLVAACCVAALSWTAPRAAWAAGGLSVAPVSLEFTADVRARSIEIANPGDAPIDVQVRLFSWRVDQAGDHYEPSQEIGFSPPMFRLEPGAKQILRLAPRRVAEREQAYRLFVDQLPGPPQGGGLQMPVRMALPLFVGGAASPGVAPGKPEGRLSWRLVPHPSGRGARLIAINHGPRRVKLINLALEAGGARHSIQSGLAGYVLTGQERAWDIPAPPRAGDLRIAADTDEGPLDTPLARPPD